MRTIKFRVWDNELKKYRSEKDGDYSLGVLSGTVRGIYGEKFPQMEVEQFTGLTDKNGKEIYEGDILGDWVDVDGKMEQSRQTVFWHEQEAQWMLDNSHKQDQSHFFSLAGELKDFEYEIIGNIHEKQTY